MNVYWHYAIGCSPDGWLVLYATNGGESDEAILARAHTNAPHQHVDPATIRVVHMETATEEERAIFDNFLHVLLIKLEARRLADAAGEPADED